MQPRAAFRAACMRPVIGLVFRIRFEDYYKKNPRLLPGVSFRIETVSRRSA